MKKRGRVQGFTIVELLIVIIVVALLATLVAVAYGNTRAQARDITIRDTADKFADAIKLVQAKTGNFPYGGVGSTTAASAATGCADGANGFQAPAVGGITCTIGDALVAMGYLPDRLFDSASLPANVYYGGTPKHVFMVYTCSGKSYLFFTLERPAASDTTSFSTAATACTAVISTASLTANGMKAAINLTDY